MKSKQKKIIIFLTAFLIIELAVIIIYVVSYFGLTIHAKGREDINVYSFDSDKIIITKYDEKKEEQGTVIVKGEKRKQIIKILCRASDHWYYNEEKFDYDYKLDFANGREGYLDVSEKIFESSGFMELTEEECKVIEELFE